MASCLECGGMVPPRAKPIAGNQPGFCSLECRRKRKRKTLAAWVIANRDRKLAGDAKARAKQRLVQPDYFKQHYLDNKDRRKREANEWYHANAERALETRKIYVAANRDKARIWGRKAANKRWAIKKNLFVEDVDPRVVFERDKGICGICREPVDVKSNWELDHIVPLSKQGPHSYANIQLAHRRCNRSKGARLAS